MPAGLTASLANWAHNQIESAESMRRLLLMSMGIVMALPKMIADCVTDELVPRAPPGASRTRSCRSW